MQCYICSLLLLFLFLLKLFLLCSIEHLQPVNTAGVNSLRPRMSGERGQTLKPWNRVARTCVSGLGLFFCCSSSSQLVGLTQTGPERSKTGHVPPRLHVIPSPPDDLAPPGFLLRLSSTCARSRSSCLDGQQVHCG